MGLGGGSAGSNAGSTTSGTGLPYSQNTSPLGFAQEANTTPTVPFDMSVQANPDVARKVRENDLNAQLKQQASLRNAIGAYDQAQGKGAVQNIRDRVDEAQKAPLSASESMGNSLENMVTRIKGAIPRLNIVSADIADNVFGKELAKKMYEFEGRDINAVRNEAYGELDALAQQVKPTLGLTESVQNNDWKGLAAGTVNAITSLGSTAVPALATMGAGLFTEMTGDALVDFNQAKAKKLGKSVEQLYKDDQAEFGVPATIGALSGALELYGMKGVGNLISDKIKGQGFKKALMFFAETQKEGLTEFVQTGLEEANRAMGEGYSAEEATKKAVNKMFSKDGLESYLQGVVGSGVAGSLSHVSNFLTNPKNKTAVNDISEQATVLQEDLNNPEVTPEAKVVIQGELNNTVSKVADIVEQDTKEEADLTPKQRNDLTDVNEQINTLQATINDPNVSDATKESLQVKLDELNTQAKDIITSKEASQETISAEPDNVSAHTEEAIVEPEKQPLVLFHGTPHKFEGFKSNKIGTGEGNQAFGAGLYFTNQRGIAENYANDISSKQKFWNYLQDGNDIQLSEEEYNFVNSELDALGFDGSRAEDAGLSEIIVDGKSKDGSAVYDALSVLFGKNAKSALDDYGLTSEQIDKMLAIKKKITDPQLYQVSIKNDNTRDFISWDDNLTKDQKSKIGDIDGNSGKEVYNNLVSKLGSQQKASDYLNSKGIDGIFYKSNKGTGGITGAGRNYVIFDENVIKIDKINDQDFKSETDKSSSKKEVVTEDVSEKRTKEVLDKANTDLDALKQVTNKPAKYKASVKRLTDAFKAGEISEQEFNDIKARFDDVIAESSPNVPKKESLTKEEITNLDNELANQDLTTDDFIQYERARAIEDANNATEAIQQPKDDGARATGETKGSEEAQTAEQQTQERLATIPEGTPSVTESRKAGDPLRSFATKIRQGKINKLGGFKASTGFDGAWDLGVEAVALSLEGGAKVADAIQSGLKAIKKTDWYKNLENKAEFDEKYQSHMENEYAEEEKQATRLRNKDIAEKRDELGLEERTRPTRKSNEELVEEANQSIKDGYDVESLIDNIIDGRKEATDKEVVILKQYQLAKEDELIQIGDKIVEATEQGKGTPLQRLIEQRDMIIQDIQRAYEAGEKTGTVSARALQARKIALMNDYSLANMLIEKRKANGDQALSAEQIEETTSEYKKIKKLNDELQVKIEALEKENRDLRSKKQIESLKTILAYEKRKLGRVQQRESIQSEIDKTKESLSQKIKEQRSTLSANPIPVNLIPDIAKLGKLYAQKGINTMEGIADAIYVDLKDSIEGLKKDDVEEVLLNYDYDTQAREEKRLEGFKLRTAKRTQELRDRLNARDFSRRKAEPLVLDAEAKKLQEELRKAKFDWEHGLERDILARRTRLEKYRDALTEIVNVPRALMASLDYSAPLRQGLVLTVNNPTIAGKAFVEMFRQSWSQKRFDNWLADLRESPEYSIMKDAGLYIADHTSPKLSAKEEQFMSNLADKIPGIGRLIKGSERAYVSYLNKLRVDVFNQVATEFENEGKTIESDKKLYDALATYINTATGRGNLGSMEGSAQILNSTFFSPRLIASRIRLLTNWANPSWYANTPEPVRVMYLRDMAKTIAVGTTLLALASLAGADVEDDPRSSDFGKIRIGDKRWDIWGGFQQFVRFFSQLATGQRKSTSDKTIREINGEGFKGETRADLIINMFRSKLAPVPATAWNLAAGETMVGDEFTWKDVPQSFLPLLANDLYKATEKDGIKGLLGSSVGVFGIGVQDYSKKEDKPKSMEEIKKELREQLNTLKEKK